jgi:Holliday junction resolvase-like predicted endonuclease
VNGLIYWEEGNLDVNEKIVCAWLASKDFFIINGIDYGQFHSDIDILAVNIKEKKIVDVEVKIRTGSTKISSGDNKQSGFQHLVRQFHYNI